MTPAWETTSAEDNSDQYRRCLAVGWEPYAVTVEGGKATHWMRREVREVAVDDARQPMWRPLPQ